jgi:predicted acyl esterase
VIVTTFPRAVRVIEHTLIPLKDGTALAARMWLPEDAEQNPVPAILEYLPYRKRDGTYERDALTHPYLAVMAMPEFASTLEVAVNRRACCLTSTPSRNKTMAWR